MGISLGAFAFWIALGAVLIASGWFKVRREQLKQETLMRLVERTGQLDEAQVKLLFPPPVMGPWPPPWHHKPDRFAAQRGLRTGGTIMLFVAAGLAVFFAILGNFGTVTQQMAAVPGFGAASLVAFLGLGLLTASRFATGPADETSKD